MQTCLRPLAIVALMVTIFTGKMAGFSHASVIVNTSDSRLHTGLDNQGWYRLHFSNGNGLAGNSDNYFVGSSAGYEYHNFFSFDLSHLNLSGHQIVSATLELTRAGNSGTFPVTMNLFDVTTDVNTLNARSFSNAVYADLGSGINYGSYSMVAQAQSFVDVFALNNSAIADIAASAGGWFSIGGALDLTNRPVGIQSHNLYGSSGAGGVQRLILDVRPVTAVPEPMSIVTFVLGTVCFAGSKALARHRNRIKK